MTYTSMSLPQFQRRFNNEQACLNHLFRLRWPDGFACPRCGNHRHTFIRSRRLYQCRACKYQASLTAGTVFHKTRTPIHKWFWMIFMMTRQKSGVSIMRVQELLDIGSYKTAWLMGHKIRKGMQDRDGLDAVRSTLHLDADLLAPYILSEEDRAPQCYTGPSAKDESTAKHLRVTRKRCTERSERKPLGSHAGGKRESGKRHEVKRQGSECPNNHSGSKGHYQSDGSSLKGKRSLRRIGVVRALIANIKGNIRGVHHGVSKKHLRRYLSEFCYRFNRREWDSELFDRAAKACLSALTITWNEVTT